jgi:hypothetical protein
MSAFSRAKVFGTKRLLDISMEKIVFLCLIMGAIALLAKLYAAAPTPVPAPEQARQ